MIQTNYEELAITFLKCGLCPLVGEARRGEFRNLLQKWCKSPELKKGKGKQNWTTTGPEQYDLKHPEGMVRNADFWDPVY